MKKTFFVLIATATKKDQALVLGPGLSSKDIEFADQLDWYLTWFEDGSTMFCNLAESKILNSYEEAKTARKFLKAANPNLKCKIVAVEAKLTLVGEPK